MSAHLPPDIETEAEDLAHGTEPTTREAAVVTFVFCYAFVWLYNRLLGRG